MKVLIIAVGRMRTGAEAELARGYVERANAAARKLALQFGVIEIDVRVSDARKEAGAMLKATPDDAVKILLDERGQDVASRQLAERLAAWRDQGKACAAFWIGGPDGAAQTLRDQADLKMAFGRQTWPHRLVRVMLAEQLYRAATILSDTPYHRD
jgi:23S rRNA (pseudouridine1915-N3)-methyltransferase